jgi:hypothetical protein
MNFLFDDVQAKDFPVSRMFLLIIKKKDLSVNLISLLYEHVLVLLATETLEGWINGLLVS